VKLFLVLLSLILNGAFIAAWLTQAAPRLAPKTGCATDCQLLRKIGASEAQLQQLGPRLEEFRKACRTRCRAIGRLRRELIDLLAEPQPNRDAIRQKQEQIVEGQRAMQELVVEQLLTEKDLLTPEQQKALFDLIRKDCGCADQPAAMDCEENHQLRGS
jgi:Spy/CpxP family protein refolding chaperone